MNEHEKKKPDVMKKIAELIVKQHVLIYVLFAAAAIYCILSIGKVKVNSDITAFLPAETETRRGLVVMEEEFVTFGTANVMISNVTYETAQELADAIAGMEGVTGVELDDTKAHYVNASALLTI